MVDNGDKYKSAKVGYLLLVLHSRYYVYPIACRCLEPWPWLIWPECHSKQNASSYFVQFASLNLFSAA
jgi:hypothetical protein